MRRHTKINAVYVLAALALTACNTAPSYRETLEQKLAGKSPQEKRLILAQECGSEANAATTKSGTSAHHAEEMKQICEEMTGNKIKQ